MPELTRKERWLMKPRDNRERLAIMTAIVVPWTLSGALLSIGWMTPSFMWVLTALAIAAPGQAAFCIWYQRRTPQPNKRQSHPFVNTP